jgi:hypothetical protein
MSTAAGFSNNKEMDFDFSLTIDSRRTPNARIHPAEGKSGVPLPGMDAVTGAAVAIYSQTRARAARHLQLDLAAKGQDRSRYERMLRFAMKFAVGLRRLGPSWAPSGFW